MQALSGALNVPVTAFFRKFEEQRDATFVKAGQGLAIERRGTRAGHQYHLLGHSIGKSLVVEPYLVTLTETSDVFPIFQHSGQEFVYIVEGEVVYRHGDKLYPMSAGDSLFFDADAPHGPEELKKLPIRLISVIVYSRTGETVASFSAGTERRSAAPARHKTPHARTAARCRHGSAGPAARRALAAGAAQHRQGWPAARREYRRRRR